MIPGPSGCDKTFMWLELIMARVATSGDCSRHLQGGPARASISDKWGRTPDITDAVAGLQSGPAPQPSRHGTPHIESRTAHFPEGIAPSAEPSAGAADAPFAVLILEPTAARCRAQTSLLLQVLEQTYPRRPVQVQCLPDSPPGAAPECDSGCHLQRELNDGFSPERGPPPDEAQTLRPSSAPHRMIRFTVGTPDGVLSCNSLAPAPHVVVLDAAELLLTRSFNIASPVPSPAERLLVALRRAVHSARDVSHAPPSHTGPGSAVGAPLFPCITEGARGAAQRNAAAVRLDTTAPQPPADPPRAARDALPPNGPQYVIALGGACDVLVEDAETLVRTLWGRAVWVPGPSVTGPDRPAAAGGASLSSAFGSADPESDGSIRPTPKRGRGAASGPGRDPDAPEITPQRHSNAPAPPRALDTPCATSALRRPSAETGLDTNAARVRAHLLRSGLSASATAQLLAGGAAALDASAEVEPRLGQYTWAHAQGRLPHGETVAAFVARNGPRCLARKCNVLRCEAREGDVRPGGAPPDAYVAVSKPWGVRIDDPRGWPGVQRFVPKFVGDVSVEHWMLRHAHRLGPRGDARPDLDCDPDTDPDAADQVHFVHQLDAATSGVLLTARSSDAASRACRAFAARATHKVYMALVFGHPVADSWESEGALAPDPTDPSGFRWRVVASGAPNTGPERGGAGERGSPGSGPPQRPKDRGQAQGKASKTLFTVVARGRLALPGPHMGREGALVMAEPVTGRRHQIRVHLAAAGHGIVGDGPYAGDVHTYRMFLHAWKLRVELPSGPRKYSRKERRALRRNRVRGSGSGTDHIRDAGVAGLADSIPSPDCNRVPGPLPKGEPESGLDVVLPPQTLRYVAPVPPEFFSALVQDAEASIRWGGLLKRRVRESSLWCRLGRSGGPLAMSPHFDRIDPCSNDTGI